MKRRFPTELAHVLGLFFLAFGTALMTRADLGISMVVAPAYLLHLKLSPIYPFFTFGVAEYITQTILLVLTIVILRRFRIAYLLSFGAAVLYGLMLDLSIWMIASWPCAVLWARLVFFLAGALMCAAGISLLFHTYLPPEAYELFVKEVSRKFNVEIHRFKTFYDCASCLIGIVLSFAFFGLWQFEGVKLGTIVYALINGWIISRITRLLEKHIEFYDALKLRGSRFFSI